MSVSVSPNTNEAKLNHHSASPVFTQLVFPEYPLHAGSYGRDWWKAQMGAQPSLSGAPYPGQRRATSHGTQSSLLPRASLCVCVCVCVCARTYAHELSHIQLFVTP